MITCTKVNSVGGGMKKVNTHNHINRRNATNREGPDEMVEFGYYKIDY